MEHPLTKSSEYLNSQSKLDQAISGKRAQGVEYTRWQSVFITGGTGFIGGYLLKEILENTNAQIDCLVRCSSAGEGKERLVGNLQEKGFWKAEYDHRLSVVIGDLSLPKLGLSDKNLADLAEQTDVIFHLGASVKWISKYESEAQANVLGFVELLKLATASRIIPIHYCSSMCTFASGGKSHNEPILEDEIFQDPGSLYGGYCQSKWVCERIVEEARKRNIPINLYRIGEVNGDSRTGLTDAHNFVNLLMGYCIITRMAPEAFRNARFNFLPVDYIAKAMFHISTQLEGNGRNYQFNSPQAFTLEEMVDEMNHCGFDVRLVSSDVWEKAMNDRSEFAKKIRPVFKKLYINEETRDVSFFDIGQNVFSRHHDTSNTDQALDGSYITCGKMIEDGILRKYLNCIMENITTAVTFPYFPSSIL
jgi:thioester reductase-like protein